MSKIIDTHAYKEKVVRHGYTVINCEGCGYWHVYPVPTEEELNAYYKDRYYETLGDNRSMTDKFEDQDRFYSMQYEDRLRHLTKFLTPGLPKTVLDIGAGYGDFLRFMMEKGWETQGLELSRQACEQIKDKEVLRIKHGGIDRLLDLGFRPSSVVTLNNVLEHIREPMGVLRSIRDRLLLADGILYVIVPNDFSILQRLLMEGPLKGNAEKHYYWVSPLVHLNYWSPKTIRAFLDRCGFKTLYFTTDFPMEIFPLMGEDYVSNPDIGRKAHLKRATFERYFSENGYEKFKDSLFDSFARMEIGRNMHVLAAAK